MATPDQLTAWLSEAEQARHDLAIGGRPVSVTSASGSAVSFSAADLGRLNSYIASLKRQLGLPSGSAPLTFQVGGH